MKSWQTTLFAAYSEACISSASILYPSAVSSDRLTALSTLWILLLILDDAFFDPHKNILRELLQEQSFIDSTIFQSPHKIRGFVNNLDVLFRQEDPPHDPIPVEGMMWEIGREIRRLSSPNWFTRFADAVTDYFHASIDCLAADIVSDCSHRRDVECYTRMRIRDFGSHFVILQIEFARNAFLPEEIRLHPTMERLTNAAAIHIAYVNDIVSYPKEVVEANSRNLIKVLMESEGLVLPEAAWRAVDLANSYMRVILELENELSTLTAVRCFMEGLKYLISGHICWGSMNVRYRCQDSPISKLQEVIDTSYAKEHSVT